jgi:hypothetical protein
MLKTIVDNIADVPGPVREFYQETADGKFALVFDGKDRLAEFRNKNIELMKSLDAFPDAAKAALAKTADLEKERTDLAAKLAAFEARPDSSKRVVELEEELSTTKAAHAAAQFKTAVSVEFLKAGGRASAVDFMVTAASKAFSMENGEVSTKEFSVKNPEQPLTLSEFMGQQMAVADFAFQPSRGGGAAPARKPVLGSHSSARELRNPSPQELGANASAIARGEVKIVD